MAHLQGIGSKKKVNSVSSVLRVEGGNMKRLVTVLLAVAVMGGFAIAATDSPIAGKWQGKMGDVPAVTLTIKDDNGKLSGTAVFYEIVDDGDGPKATGQSTAEMVDAKLEGKIFSFRTKGSQGEVFSYQMELTGKNEGKFKGDARVAGGSEAPKIKMVRE
jgi:hypothetical protein